MQEVGNLKFTSSRCPPARHHSTCSCVRDRYWRDSTAVVEQNSRSRYFRHRSELVGFKLGRSSPIVDGPRPSRADLLEWFQIGADGTIHSLSGSGCVSGQLSLSIADSVDSAASNFRRSSQ